MHGFLDDWAQFSQRRQCEADFARQLAALQLACGANLTHALDADPPIRQRLARRIERILERERLKGLRRHWSYDLNRHIALKQALDRLR